MDAFAVAVSNGMLSKGGRGALPKALLCGGVFGLYQGVMPVIGYALGSSLGEYIERIDHYIALVLLGFIGIKMIAESRSGESSDDEPADRLTLSTLMVQGFATSVDALAVGVSFAALSVNIVVSAGIICFVTLAISAAGFILGKKFGRLSGSYAEIAGGTALILIGIKIFVSHVF